MLNPYELLRLARNRGIRVKDLVGEYTEGEGTFLLFQGEDSACVFLGPEGCTVHPDRPLVCRLYPLGRYVPPEGEETFGIQQGHPESAGVFAEPHQLLPGDTVGAFLHGQDVERHVHAAHQYFELFKRIRDLASKEDSEVEESDDSAGPFGHHWLYADAIAESYCMKNGLPVPDSAEDQMDAHIRAITEWAERRAADSRSG